MLIFTDVNYFLSPSLPPKLQSQLNLVLVDNGGTPVSLDKATHVVTNSSQFEGWETISKHVAVVTDKWVTRSVLSSKIQPTQSYSANPAMIFSGVVACATGLCPRDVEVVTAGITTLGGQWRTTLTRDVTHLFAVTAGSEKYETALLFQEMTQIKIIVPQWFDDAVKLGTGSLPTAEYEWPDPRVLRQASQNATGAPRSSQLAGDKKILFKTAVWTPGQEVPPPQAAQRNIWHGRRLLLSPSLGLPLSRRQAVEAGITRANGIVVRYADDGEGTEEEAVRKLQDEDVDVFVTRYRSGPAYVKAVKAHKTIGTLAWLFHVESTGSVSRPLDQLLHYPTPPKPIDGFSAHEITLTNYTGEAREYLKKLIAAMGAQFTPSMSGQNTVLVAAYLSGTKATKARTWSIPIVNHTWLEDCFVQWRNLTVGLEKYIVFPPGVDFSQMLGERGVGKKVLDEVGLATFDDDEPAAETLEPKLRRTESSAIDENEVEEAVGLFDGDDDVFMDDSTDEIRSRTNGRKPLSTKSLTRRRHVSPSSDRDSPSRRTRSSTKPVATPANISREIVVGSSRSRKPLRAESIGGDSLPRSSPIESPSDRKARQKRVDEESDGPLVPLARKRKLPVKEEEEESSESDSERHRERKPVQKSRHKPVSTIITDSGEEESLDFRTAAAPKTPEPKRTTKPSSRKVTNTTTSIPTPASPVRPQTSPRRVPSVVIQTTVKSVLARNNSSVAIAPETPSRKRERPTSHKGPPPVASRSVAPTTFPRASTKRTAATKAIQKLHDEVMPDVLNFQQEMRNRTKGKGKERVYDKSHDEDDHPIVKVKYKSKGRVSDVRTVGTSDEEKPTVKKRKTNDSGKQAGKSAVALDDDVGGSASLDLQKSGVGSSAGARDSDYVYEESAKSSKKLSQSKSSSAGRKSDIATRHVKLMTTQVNLSDDVIKVLTKLGVKVTTKPAECTHLIARSVVRTEKFLCALSVAPFILSESWALQSAAAKMLLPEEDHLLKDSDNEKKFKFKLADALRRAKSVRGRLFTGHTFYVTPKVPVDLKLLRNVVTSGGGQLLIQTPTVRVMKASDNRHVVSCEADVSLWRPLAELEYPIYNHELLLTCTLKQEVDWDNEAYRVSESR